MSRLSRRAPLTRSKRLRRGPKRDGPDTATLAAMAAFHALALARDARCASCGHDRHRDLEVHHTLKRQDLEKRDHDPWDPDLGLVLCGQRAPNACHPNHTSRSRVVPYERLRPENVAAAELLGLGWLLEKHHPRGGN